MPATALEYPKEGRNTVNRKGKMRGKYDMETVHTIMQQARVVHVSFSPFPDDPFPVILPMIGVMGRCSKRSYYLPTNIGQAHMLDQAQGWTSPWTVISMATSPHAS